VGFFPTTTTLHGKKQAGLFKKNAQKKTKRCRLFFFIPLIFDQEEKKQKRPRIKNRPLLSIFWRQFFSNDNKLHGKKQAKKEKKEATWMPQENKKKTPPKKKKANQEYHGSIRIE
jgi:hypothetical protein